MTAATFLVCAIAVHVVAGQSGDHINGRSDSGLDQPHLDTEDLIFRMIESVVPDLDADVPCPYDCFSALDKAPSGAPEPVPLDHSIWGQEAARLMPWRSTGSQENALNLPNDPSLGFFSSEPANPVSQQAASPGTTPNPVSQQAASPGTTPHPRPSPKPRIADSTERPANGRQAPFPHPVQYQMPIQHQVAFPNPPAMLFYIPVGPPMFPHSSGYQIHGSPSASSPKLPPSPQTRMGVFHQSPQPRMGVFHSKHHLRSSYDQEIPELAPIAPNGQPQYVSPNARVPRLNGRQWIAKHKRPSSTIEY